MALSSIDLPLLPIDTQVAFTSLEDGKNANDLLQFNGTEWQSVPASGLAVSFPLEAPDSVAQIPQYTFSGDTTTGIFTDSDGADFKIKVQNTHTLTFTTGHTEFIAPLRLRDHPNIASSPAGGAFLYRKTGNDGLFYRTSTAEYDLTSGVTVPLRLPHGTAAVPTYSFDTTGTTAGLFLSGGTDPSLARQGVASLTIGADGTRLTGTKPIIVLEDVLAADVPGAVPLGEGHVYAKDGFTGLFYKRGAVEVDLTTSTLPAIIQIANSSAAVPNITYTTATDTGLFYDGTSVGLTQGGLGQLTISGNEVKLNDSYATFNQIAAPAAPIITTFGQLYMKNASDGLFWQTATGGEINLTEGVSDPILLDETKTSTTPNYSFAGDSGTGMFQAAANIIGFATGGTTAATLSATLLSLPQANSQFLGQITNAPTPTFSFQTDNDTGLFNPSSGIVAVSINGVEQGRFGIAGLTMSSTSVIQSGVGSAAVPAYSYSGATNTGHYLTASPGVGTSVGGNNRLEVTAGAVNAIAPLLLSDQAAAPPNPGATDGYLFKNTGNEGLFWRTNSGIQQIALGDPLLLSDNTAATPTYSFAADTDTGMYRDTLTSDLRLAQGGTDTLSISSAVTRVLSGAFRVPDGNTAAPSISFLNDTDSGLYRQGPADIRLAVGGANYITAASNLVAMQQPVSLQNGSSTLPSIHFDSDSNTGLHWPGSDILGMGAGGSLLASIEGPLTAGGSKLRMQNAAVILASDGTVTNPGIAFNSQANTGMALTTANLQLVRNGAVGLTLEANRTVLNSMAILPDQGVAPAPTGDLALGQLYKKTGDVGLYWQTSGQPEIDLTNSSPDPIRISDGSPAAPSYSFSAQIGTGMFRDTATGSTGFTVAGNERIRMPSGGGLSIAHVVTPPTTAANFSTVYASAGDRLQYNTSGGNIVDLSGMDRSEKSPVSAATIANLNLATYDFTASGLDGIASLPAGSRVLVKDQTTQAENGIYTVGGSGLATRSSDAYIAHQVTVGTKAYVQAGTVNSGRTFLTSVAPAVVGTNIWTWSEAISADALDDLTDVTLNAAAANQLMVYDFGASRWRNEFVMSVAKIHPTVLTSATALTVNTGYRIDTSGGGFTITLPTITSANDYIRIIDVGGSLTTNFLIIAASGGNLIETSALIIVNIPYAAYEFYASPTNNRWIQVSPNDNLGDDLGNHTATTDLLLAGNNITQLPNTSVVTSPSVRFNATLATGLFSPADGTVAIASAGGEVARFTQAVTTLGINAGANLVQILAPLTRIQNGSAVAPSLSFTGGLTSGLSLVTGGIAVSIAGSEALRFDQNRSLAVGGGADANARAIAHFTSTTKGILLPRHTTGQRVTLGGLLGAGDEGMIVFDTDLTNGQLQYWNGTAWTGVGDNLGDHTATQNVLMSTFELQNAGRITVDNIDLDANIIAITNLNGNLTLQPNGTGEVLLTKNPTQALGAVPKQYVDALVSGLDPKNAVNVKTAGALPAYTAAGVKVGKTLTADANGALTVDGISVLAGDRVLVDSLGSATDIDNGVYSVTDAGSVGTPWILTRSLDADENVEVTNGMYTLVTQGTLYQATGWVLLTLDASIDVDVNILNFGQFLAPGDNLGNHTATQNLNMGSNLIQNLRSSGAAFVSGGGNPLALSFNTNTTTGLIQGAINTMDFVTNDRSRMLLSDQGLTISPGVSPTPAQLTAALQIDSTTKGLLKPRMTSAQRNAIVTPAAGLEVYDSTQNLPYYHNGIEWFSQPGAKAISLTSAPATPATITILIPINTVVGVKVRVAINETGGTTGGYWEVEAAFKRQAGAPTLISETERFNVDNVNFEVSAAVSGNDIELSFTGDPVNSVNWNGVYECYVAA
jgi:hypothetical protein